MTVKSRDLHCRVAHRRDFVEIIRHVPGEHLERRFQTRLRYVTTGSQRGRAMLHVIEYFAKSLEIIQGHWKLHKSIDRVALSCIIS